MLQKPKRDANYNEIDIMVLGTEPRKTPYVHDITTFQVIDFCMGLWEGKKVTIVDLHDPTS